MKTVFLKTVFLALSGLFALSAALAQPAGAWLIQGGMTRISPDVKSGNLSAPSPEGSQVNVSGDTQPTLQLTYLYTPNWAVALPLGAGFKHKLYGAGSIAGVGQIGTVSALPISVFAQYRFGESRAAIRPYAMLGLSYAYFRDAQGSAALNGLNPLNPQDGRTGLKIDSKWAMSPGLGVWVQLDDTWFMDLSWSKSFLKTTSTLSTGQRIDATLNPSIATIGLGRRF